MAGFTLKIIIDIPIMSNIIPFYTIRSSMASFAYKSPKWYKSPRKVLEAIKAPSILAIKPFFEYGNFIFGQRVMRQTTTTTRAITNMVYLL